MKMDGFWRSRVNRRGEEWACFIDWSFEVWLFSMGFGAPFCGVMEESGVQWLRKSQIEGWSIEAVLSGLKRITWYYTYIFR